MAKSKEINFILNLIIQTFYATSKIKGYGYNRLAHVIDPCPKCV